MNNADSLHSVKLEMSMFLHCSNNDIVIKSTFHGVFVLLRDFDITEISCLDTVGKTTRIGWILALAQNSVNLVKLRNLHCTESLRYS